MTGKTDVTTEDHRRALRVVALTLLVIAVITVTLIAAGAFDPQPFGASALVEQPGPRTLTDGGEAVAPLTAPWPTPPWVTSPNRFSIRLTAAHTAGEPDSGYGLALGDDDGRLVVALSPLGYVTVREEQAGAEPIVHLPWQTWPHVRPGTAANEIWLDVENGDGRAAVTVWINRELLWQGAVGVAPRQSGLYQTTFGEPATVDFSRVEWFAEP